MECPNCHTRCGPADHFCGNCGHALDNRSVDQHPPVDRVELCPFCKEPRRPILARCHICNTTFAERDAEPSDLRPLMECPTHGVMQGDWVLCPECLKDDRRVRLTPHEERRQPAPRRDTEIISRLPVQTAVLAFLVQTAGEQVGQFFPMKGAVTDIGNDEHNHVVLADRGVSGFHARLRRDEDGRFTIEDRGSTNGTRINGELVIQPIPVRDDDELELGSTTLVLKVVRLRSRRARRRTSSRTRPAARVRQEGAGGANTAR